MTQDPAWAMWFIWGAGCLVIAMWILSLWERRDRAYRYRPYDGPMYRCAECGHRWTGAIPRPWWTRKRVAIALAGAFLTAAAFYWAKILGWL